MAPCFCYLDPYLKAKVEVDTLQSRIQINLPHLSRTFLFQYSPLFHYSPLTNMTFIFQSPFDHRLFEQFDPSAPKRSVIPQRISDSERSHITGEADS